MKKLAMLSLAFMSACAVHPSKILDFYDPCLNTTKTFQEFAACGRAAKEKSCASAGICPKADVFMSYTDAIASDVQAGNLSEGQAKMKWIDYRTQMLTLTQNQANAEAAQAAARKPVFCNKIGYTVACY